MMTRRLPPREIEQLSAYLDDQLPPAKRTRLEARLAAEPALQQELADLKTTVLALRGLPALKVPRNFTLTPEMAKRPWSLPSFAFPTLRLATALAAVAFAFVVVQDFNASRLSSAAPAAVEVARVQQEAPMEATEVPESEAVIERPVAVVKEVEEEVEEPVAVVPEAETVVEEAVTVVPEAETAVEKAVEVAPAGEAAVEELVPSVEETVPLDKSTLETQVPSLALEDDSTPLAGASGGPTGERQQAALPAEGMPRVEIEGPAQIAEAPGPPVEQKAVAVETPAAGTEQAGEPLPAPSSPNPYRPLTIGLAMLTLLLATFTLLARRIA